MVGALGCKGSTIRLDAHVGRERQSARSEAKIGRGRADSHMVRELSVEVVTKNKKIDVARDEL